MITTLVDTQTGMFIEAGGEPDARYKRIIVPENPDPRRHRYSGDSAKPIRQATAQEIAAYDAAQKDAQAQREYRVDLMALAAALFKAQTGKFPTAAQAAAIKADFVTARKALL